MKLFHTTFVNRMEKEADQVQFFKELRVPIPCKLTHPSSKIGDNI